MNSRFFIKTYGCQMNVNDSEKMAGLLESRGWTQVYAERSASLFIVNTCAVREKAQEKLFSYLGRLKRYKELDPACTIVVAGCVSQLLKEEIRRRAPFVDLLLGTNAYPRLLEYLDQRGESDFRLSRHWNEVTSLHRRSSFSAFLSIMEGCDNFCSYCVVPFTRGREKSRPLSLILRELDELSAQGYKEVVLLGQNVDAYLDPEKGGGFADLLEVVAQRSGASWIRFLTSHPSKFSLRIAEVMARNDKICRALHLPFQAGSDRILSLMNRGYSKAEYLSLVKAIKERVPDIAMAADIIVGFPTEREEDFLETMEIVEEVRFENIFSFLYSPRPGTKSSKMEDDVPPSVKGKRLIRLQERQKEIQLEGNLKRIGSVQRVLLEERNRKDPSQTVGRTAGGRVVNILGPCETGQFADILIDGAGPHNLKGRIPL